MLTDSAPNNPFAADAPSGAHARAVWMLLAAGLLTAVLYAVPYLGWLTYPLRLLVTFIHEGSHALMALLTGGQVASIAIEPDGSGLTMTRGGLNLLVSSAGYLGATLYGAGLISLLRRGVKGNLLLAVTGGCVAVVTLGILGGLLTLQSLNVFGLAWGVALTAGLMFAARKLSAQASAWTAAFIGVQCALNALFDLGTLFHLSLSSSAHTDALNMQNQTWIPAPVWATLWIGLSLAMLFVALRPTRAPRVRSNR